MSDTSARIVYEFGDVRLDAAQRLLRSRANGEPLPLTAKAFEILLYLVQHRGELVDKATLMKAIWPNVVVEENNLNQNISALRRVLGEKPGEHRFIVTEPGRGYRFVAEVGVKSSARAPEPPVPAPSAAPADGAESSRSLPSIRFCTTPDGVRLAYTIAGSGPALVRCAHWLSHVEYDWESPVYHHLLRDLSRRHRLVRYDHRGNGLSDWNVQEISLQAFLTDLETVVDAAGLERFALLGLSAGCPPSIAYAAMHPDRVSRLVLHGGFLKGMRSDAEAEAMATLMRVHWGQNNPGFRQLWTTMLAPDATLEEQQCLNELQRLSTSPENAVRIMIAIHRTDVTELCARIQVPTLVFHVRDDGAIPLEAGRSMAASIPGARFVLLEGRNHLELENDPATARFKEELFSFLGG